MAVKRQFLIEKASSQVPAFYLKEIVSDGVLTDVKLIATIENPQSNAELILKALQSYLEEQT